MKERVFGRNQERGEAPQRGGAGLNRERGRQMMSEIERTLFSVKKEGEKTVKLKRILSVLLAVAVTGTIVLPALATGGKVTVTQTPMQLTYDEPANSTYTSVGGASKWEAASLPIGNGKLGANVFGEVGEELLTINEETLWSGGRGSVTGYDGGNPDPTAAKKAYDTISNKLLNNQSLEWNEMESLHGDPRDQSGYDHGYQPLGDLKFNFNHNFEKGSYHRTLDLDNGLSTVKYTTGGVTYTREYFASYPDNVIVAHFTADGGKLNFTTSFASKQDATVKVDNNGYITVAGTMADHNENSHQSKGNGLLHNTQIAVVADGGSVKAEGNGIKVSNANSVTVYLTAATDYKNQFSNGTTEYWYRTGESAEALNARVKDVLDQAVSKGYTEVKTAHTNDYTNLYNRVKLDVGQKQSNKMTDDLLHAYQDGYGLTAAEQRYLEVLLFQYGRYLLISGSRADSQLPTTLQGIWNDRSGTDWNSDIHTNINLQMNYWLSGSCNLTECAMPLVNYMNKLKEPGGRTVEIYTGSQHGIMAHTQNTPYGYTAPGWDIQTWGWSPAAATWLMQNCYDYYQYSNDTEILKSTIYPMMKEQVLMYEDLLKVKDGRKVMPIALSPEIGPVTCGNTFEQSLIWQLYADTIEAAELLNLDSDQITTWKATMDQLKPIEIGDSGQIKEWYHETTLGSVDRDQANHRHLSNLLGLFPGDAIDTPEEIAAAKVSLNNKNFGKVGAWGENPDGGWTYGQMIPSWARVGEGANAYFCVNQMIKYRLFENLWDYHDAAIFQIDGNYGYSAGVAEMLMQSNNGVLRLLPAISKEWANGSVSGLLAEGGFEVSMSWKDRKVTRAEIMSKNGGPCTVQNPFGENLKIVDSKGNVISGTPNAENGAVTFDTAKGETYVLTERVIPQLNLKATRAENGKVTLTWEAQPDVTYTITRKEIN